LYEWKGLKKLYAHIIRQIENGLADWSKDFGEVETPLLIKYVKNDYCYLVNSVDVDNYLNTLGEIPFYCLPYNK
jgi:hypothetical protein